MDASNISNRTSDPIAPKSAHINAALSDFASAYAPPGLIADFVSPPILVDKKSDSFHKRTRKDVETLTDNRVGERGQINESSYDVSSGSYTCLGYGLKGPVSRALQATADPALSPKEFAAQDVMLKNMLQREVRVATQITTSGNWATGSTSAAGNVWSDTTSGTPLTDVHTALEAMPATGDARRVGVCALEVFNALSRHPQIRDLHGTGQGQIDENTLARYLRLDELYVSDAWKVTSNPGQATITRARIWLATVFAVVLVPRQLMSTEQTMFSATFRRNLGGSSNGILAREWFVEDEGTEGTDYVAVTHEDDEVVIQDDAGYLITSVLA